MEKAAAEEMEPCLPRACRSLVVDTSIGLDVEVSKPGSSEVVVVMLTLRLVEGGFEGVDEAVVLNESVVFRCLRAVVGVD